ncbi:auxin-responsive protein IAA9-like [Typha latifolia]|uniref:auxin-responsive protein IAA9-like n=1 Tax=Typha latifolia TaxID=4733 RepID=UPI003C2E033B
MELELGLALPNNDASSHLCRKRGSDETPAKTTLPLFVKNVESDDDNFNSESSVLVGWPPIKFARKRCEKWSNNGFRNDVNGVNYVKVNMKGVAIGRKVDLSLHHSYGALFNTLGQMFPNLAKHRDGKMISMDSAHHHDQCVVTYEDADGDWMMVGDVPWEAFIRSVKRLKILG